MADAGERLGAGEAALLDVDLRLVPQLEPRVAQRLVEMVGQGKLGGRRDRRQRGLGIVRGERVEHALQARIGLVDRHVATFVIHLLAHILVGEPASTSPGYALRPSCRRRGSRRRQMRPPAGYPNSLKLW
jgi:hypothetical protein